MRINAVLTKLYNHETIRHIIDNGMLHNDAYLVILNDTQYGVQSVLNKEDLLDIFTELKEKENGICITIK